MEIVSSVISSSICFALGKAYNWIEERKRNRNKNIEAVQNFVNESWVKEIFQRVEYENGWYNVDFHGSKFENGLDDFLMHLTLYSMSYNENDSNPFMLLLGQMLMGTLRSFDIQSYLYNLWNYTQKVNMPNPYNSLIEWGKNAGVLGKEFFEVPSNRYIKTLNW